MSEQFGGYDETPAPETAPLEADTEEMPAPTDEELRQMRNQSDELRAAMAAIQNAQTTSMYQEYMAEGGPIPEGQVIPIPDPEDFYEPLESPPDSL